jgi:2'-5' RNA ligase
VQRGAFLRLFVALVVPETASAAIRAWQAERLGAAAGRILREHHVTLAFLGRRPAADVARVAGALRHAATGVDGAVVLRPTRYRETRSVGMLVLEDEGGRAAALASDVQQRLARLGMYVPERRPWLPHLTVLRFRTPPRLRPPMPELGAISPSEAAVYHSVLRSGGAQYDILESVALGG